MPFNKSLRDNSNGRNYEKRVLCFPGGRKGPAHSRCSKFFLIHGIDLRVKAKVAAGSLTALSGTQLKHNKKRVLSISSSFTKKTKKTQY